MYKISKTIIFFLVANGYLYSQSVGIGTTTPDSTALLELKSTSKGFMMPRMNTTQRDAIVNPKQGLQIYNIDDRCTDIFNGSIWEKNCGLKVNGETFILADTWRARADFGGIARNSATGFSIGTNAYIGVGANNGTDYGDFWEYNANTNIWSQKADFAGVARNTAVGFSINGKGYLGTGLAGNPITGIYKKDFWEYDPISNAWTQKADFGGTSRFGAVGFSIDSKGYIGTGSDGSYKKDFWEYDPILDTWIQKADFGGTSRFAAVGFSIMTKGYLGTGFDGSSRKDFWEYSPNTNTWIQKAMVGGNSRYSAVGFSIGTNGYIGTGWGNFNDFWEYKPIANIWTQKANLVGGGRSGAVGFSIGTKGYIGIGTNNISDFWQYSTQPDTTRNYVEYVPADASAYIGHDWTSSGNSLQTSQTNVIANVRGDLVIDGSVNIGEKLTSPLNFENVLGNKISLWDNGLDNDYGFGIQAGKLQIYTAGQDEIAFGYGNSNNFTQKMTFFPGTAQLGINCLPLSGYNLSVNGSIKSKEVVVELANWPDYVFAKEYQLPSLLSVEKYINEFHHLPNILPAIDIEKNGLNLGDTQKRMMAKIEELTLYIIELKKENELLRKDVQEIKSYINK